MKTSSGIHHHFWSRLGSLCRALVVENPEFLKDFQEFSQSPVWYTYEITAMGTTYDSSFRMVKQPMKTKIRVPQHQYTEYKSEDLGNGYFSGSWTPKTAVRKYVGTLDIQDSFSFDKETGAVSVRPLHSVAVFENGKGNLELWPVNGMQAFRLDTEKIAPKDLEALKADLEKNKADPSKAQFKLKNGNIIDTEADRVIVEGEPSSTDILLSGAGIRLITSDGELPAYNKAVKTSVSVEDLIEQIRAQYGDQGTVEVEKTYPANGSSELILREPKKDDQKDGDAKALR